MMNNNLGDFKLIFTNTFELYKTIHIELIDSLIEGGKKGFRDKYKELSGTFSVLMKVQCGITPTNSSQSQTPSSTFPLPCKTPHILV